MTLLALGFLLDRPLRQRMIALLPRAISPLDARFYCWLLVISFLLALGPIIRFNGREITYGPYLLLYQWVPGFDGLRVPGPFYRHAAPGRKCPIRIRAGPDLNRIRSSAIRVVLGTAIALLVLVEYASFPVEYALGSHPAGTSPRSIPG